MRKIKVLLNENNDIKSACIISLSQTDLDNLKLLQQYLPKDLNKKFSNQEKEIIDKYNKFIDNLKIKNKSSIITIDLILNKI